MKQNRFGETIAQPGDDPADIFQENGFHSDGIEAFGLGEDPNFGFCCMLRNEDLEEVQAHDFADEGAMNIWLQEYGIPISD